MMEPAPPTAVKVSLYVTHRGRLLVFLTPANPKTLPQVPGGTVEIGEDFETAALRELEEETGLTYAGALRPLGTGRYHFKYRGFDEIHERHFFHVPLPLEPEPPERWAHTEMNSSLGFKPYALDLHWLDIDAAERLLGYGFADRLPELRTALATGDA
jgi:8-oxo-dGTP diphosphatase